MAYRSSHRTVCSAKYHLIWCPEYRRCVRGGRSGARLKEVVDVHLLAEVPPAVALSKLVQLLRGRSSRVLRQEFPYPRRLPDLCSPSWSVSTFGGALEIVRRYVEGRKIAGEKARAA
ncbi:MAG TPA: transposase [Acidimicrobiales bacterium]|nr:transposase [Acidimicrobiales bacterium]